jgi:glycosyltransferase involved in cell wall biosynthesis
MVVEQRRKGSVASGSQASARALAVEWDDTGTGPVGHGVLKSLSDADPLIRGHETTPKPRVLHVLEAVAGGTLRHLVDILHTVKGVEHHVVLPPDDAPEQGEDSVNAIAAQELQNAGATLHRIEMLRNPVHPGNAAGILRLRRLVSTLQPTVVHGHSSVGGAFARAAVWGTPVPDIYTPNGVARSRAILMVEKILAHRTSRFVAVSASEGERALTLGLTSKDRLVVIPNGIDLQHTDAEKFDLRKELQLHADVPIVGTVSRLTHQKAPEDFVRICREAARSNADVHFVLIGAGQLQRKVEQAVQSAGLADRFHQIPFLRRASIAIEQMNVFVLASLFEGAAYAPLEAMLAGVPVVLSDVTGNMDTVEDGVSGLLFPFGDTSAMGEAVASLLSDQAARQALTQGAQERLESHFDRRTMGARLEELYREIAVNRV